MVVIRLMRAGAKNRPFFRVVAADSRRQRDGRFLEILGHYDPIAKPHELVLHKDKVERWLSYGAQPSVQVASLIRSAGIVMHQPKVASESAAPKVAKKKVAAKRAKPRAASARKTRAKAGRAKKKSASKAAKKV